MKKRIGSREYDTESAELIAEAGVGTVYRKRTRGREWFLVIGDRIEPLTDDEARSIIGETVYRERQPDPESWFVRVDKETHDRLSAESKRRGVPISVLVKEWAVDL